MKSIRRWGTTIISVVAMLLLWDTIVLYPFRILVVLFHELGHAIATVLTGGKVVGMGLQLNEGGHTLSQGGSRFIILNAGYLGSLLTGLVLLRLVRGGSEGKRAATVLGAIAILTAALWIRPIVSFGFIYTIAAGALFMWLGRSGGGLATSVVRGIGIFSVVYAIIDIRDDLLRCSGCGVSDADMLSSEYGMPSLFWGVLWLGIGVTLMWRVRDSLLPR